MEAILMNIPEFEPQIITAGESLSWKKKLEVYPAGDGWTLTYYFRGAGPGFNAVATADGDAYSVSVAASSTTSMSAGVYTWEAWLSHTDGRAVMVDSGHVDVRGSLKSVSTSTTVDDRSEVKKILDAIDAMVLGKATLDQQSYQIAGRQLVRIPINDLLSLRTRYAQLYNRELRAEKIREGAPFFKNIHTRFDVPGSTRTTPVPKFTGGSFND
jgi:hypothetical protein